MVSWKCFAIIISSAIASEVFYWVYKRMKPKSKKAHRIHDALFFSYPPVPCKFHEKDDKTCNFFQCGNYRVLLEHLNNAKYDLDVCVYMLTTYEIANAIYLAHTRGVKVRIIGDAGMAYSQGSQLKTLSDRGIPFRTQEIDGLMHHKFAVVDARRNIEPFVITGSLNWTTQGVTKNFENVMVTSTPELVAQYSAEFERLWKQFAPH